MTLSLFLITLTKFMFICIWKRMRQMNDDLLLRISVNWAVLMSVWIPTMISPMKFKKSTNKINGVCTGIFSSNEEDLDWQDLVNSKVTYTHMYTLWFWVFITLILMIFVKIGRRKISLEQPGLIPQPKDLESMLLNFTLMILLAINLLGFNFYWK